MATRYADMFVELDQDQRTEPPYQGDETATLVGFLRWQRETLELKCAGLDPEQLARRPLPQSNLSLLGLVRHLADVELDWFRRGLAREDVRRRFSSADDPDGDFDGAVADPDVVAQAWAAWREEVAYADRFVATAPDLLSVSVDDPHRGPLSLRFVLIHMIEEYARHLGHADVLRQLIDGRVGQ
ncbi:MAG TPA: DinB family protein [Lapillicoccus sp.]